MALIPAICTQCGAKIEVDDTKETGICKHCGTAFIPDKKMVITELEEWLSIAEGYKTLEEYDDAVMTYQKVVGKYPQDVRGWLGCVYTCFNGAFGKEAEGVNKEWLDSAPFCEWYKNAYVLSDDETRKQLEEDKRKYIDVVDQRWSDYKSRVSFDDFKKFIGDSVFSDARGIEKLYVSGNELYYKVSCFFNSIESYVVFEITDMDSEGSLLMQVVEEVANISFFRDNGYLKMQKRNWIFETKNTMLKVYYYDGNEILLDGRKQSLKRQL